MHFPFGKAWQAADLQGDRWWWEHVEEITEAEETTQGAASSFGD